MSILSFRLVRGIRKLGYNQSSEQGCLGVARMTLSWQKLAFTVVSFFLLTFFAAAQMAPAPADATPPPVRQARSTSKRKHASKPSPVPEQPTVPAAPLTPEQMPPVPPQVTYRDGLLTIVASNSTLSDILHAVSQRTGATLDAPPQLIGERVAVHIGPGSPRDVLASLLTGPRFDYILVGADGDANAVRSIILTANQTSPTTVARQQPVRTVAPPPDESDDDADDQPAPTVQEQAPPPQPTQQMPRRRFGPQQPPDQNSGQPASPEGGSPGQQQVRTPEQLLQDLRRMQPGNPPQN